jgi:uncharacterized Zn finger protein (UPF0148 family)
MPIDHACPDCGENLSLPPTSVGRTSCPKCGAQLEVRDDMSGNKMVRRVKSFGPEMDYTDELLDKLTKLEKNSLEESAIAAGQGAYIASEFMALRALEAVSRRITDEERWNSAINQIENDFGDLSGYIDMLRDRRNEVAHPDAEESTEDQAQRTFEQVKHMLHYLEEEI